MHHQVDLFYRQVNTRYITDRNRMVEQYRAKGYAPLLGRELAVQLFEEAIRRTTEQFDECQLPATPYLVAYTRYTRDCTSIVWDGTLSKISQLFENYLRTQKSTLPEDFTMLRKMARTCLGPKAYHAVLYAVGGYFELDLVLHSLGESAYQSVPIEHRYVKLSAPKKKVVPKNIQPTSHVAVCTPETPSLATSVHIVPQQLKLPL